MVIGNSINVQCIREATASSVKGRRELNML